MELTVAQTAALTHTDAQLVRRAIRDGLLGALRRIGQTTVIDDIAATAWKRAVARGRLWTDEVREAALDLASTGNTDRLSSSERSRLRSRLRTITAAEFAHAAGGVGGAWGRYTTVDHNVGIAIGPDVVDLAALGIVEGDVGIHFACVDDLDAFELHNDVRLDAYGNLCVVERPADDRAARILLDTYLLGGSRESAAAATALERACRGH
jgi:hypothetical protein